MIRAYAEPLRAFADEVGSAGPVTVRGGSTRWTAGGPLEAGTREVRAPAGMVEHRPEEMTVTVRAGTAVADLHAELALANQLTALPERPGGTVGGALAVGENDVTRLGRGRTREALLQAVYVSAEGELVTAGGPTVKNVSGFDIPRLLVGSLGTLGLVAEVILRTRPVPARQEWLRADGVDPTAVLASTPTAASILWDGATTWVLLAGLEPDVEVDRARLGGLGPFASASPPDLPAHRWSCTPTEALGVDRRQTGAFVAEVGVGVVHAERRAPARARSDGVIAIERRLKDLFDPSGRLNPGRHPGAG